MVIEAGKRTSKATDHIGGKKSKTASRTVGKQQRLQVQHIVRKGPC